MEEKIYNKMEELFESIGFNKNEIKIYLDLLKYKKSSVLEIAKRIYASNIKREHARTNNKIITDLPYSKNGNKQELKKVFRDLNIEVSDKNTGNEWVTTTKKEDHIELDNRRIVPNLVPNVIAMGAKDAVYLLENAGLKVVLKGRGSVKSQSVPPGTLIIKGQEIILEMSFI